MKDDIERNEEESYMMNDIVDEGKEWIHRQWKEHKNEEENEGKHL